MVSALRFYSVLFWFSQVDTIVLKGEGRLASTPLDCNSQSKEPLTSGPLAVPGLVQASLQDRPDVLPVKHVALGALVVEEQLRALSADSAADGGEKVGRSRGGVEGG